MVSGYVGEHDVGLNRLGGAYENVTWGTEASKQLFDEEESFVSIFLGHAAALDLLLGHAKARFCLSIKLLTQPSGAVAVSWRINLQTLSATKYVIVEVILTFLVNITVLVQKRWRVFQLDACPFLKQCPRALHSSLTRKQLAMAFWVRGIQFRALVVQAVARL